MISSLFRRHFTNVGSTLATKHRYNVDTMFVDLTLNLNVVSSSVKRREMVDDILNGDNLIGAGSGSRVSGAGAGKWSG